VSRVRAEVEVDAPPDEVWKVIANPQNMPAWDKRIASVRDIPEGELQEGSEYTTDLRFMGLSTSIRAKVKDIRPPEYALVELTGPPLRATVTTTLSSLNGGRTKLEQDVEYHLRGGPLGRVLGRLLQHLGAGTILRRGTLAQKRQVETGDE